MAPKKKCSPVQTLSLGNTAPSLAQLQGSAMNHATQESSQGRGWKCEKTWHAATQMGIQQREKINSLARWRHLRDLQLSLGLTTKWQGSVSFNTHNHANRQHDVRHVQLDRRRELIERAGMTARKWICERWIVSVSVREREKDFSDASFLIRFWFTSSWFNLIPMNLARIHCPIYLFIFIFLSEAEFQSNWNSRTSLNESFVSRIKLRWIWAIYCFVFYALSKEWVLKSRLLKNLIFMIHI